MTSKAPSGINVFVHEKRGNVAVLFALMMIPVVGAIGAAVDYARMLRLKTQLQTVADAATMAGLKTYRETGDAEEGRQRLLAFIDEGLEKDGMTRAREADEEGADLMGGTRRQGRIVVVSDAVINTENSTVKPVLATTIETPFMSFLGVEQLPVEVYTGGAVAASSITGTKAIEVSVMLDVSGSMGGDKIDDMKLAAGDFIDIILPDGVEVDNRRIGLVPFSQYVNAGSYASAATGLAPTLQVQTGTQTTGVVFSATEFDWLSLNQCRNRVRDTTTFGNYSNNEARQYCISNFESRRVFRIDPVSDAGARRRVRPGLCDPQSSHVRHGAAGLQRLHRCRRGSELLRRAYESELGHRKPVLFVGWMFHSCHQDAQHRQG